MPSPIIAGVVSRRTPAWQLTRASWPMWVAQAMRLEYWDCTPRVLELTSLQPCRIARDFSICSVARARRASSQALCRRVGEALRTP